MMATIIIIVDNQHDPVTLLDAVPLSLMMMMNATTTGIVGQPGRLALQLLLLV